MALTGIVGDDVIMPTNGGASVSVLGVVVTAGVVALPNRGNAGLVIDSSSAQPMVLMDRGNVGTIRDILGYRIDDVTYTALQQLVRRLILMGGNVHQSYVTASDRRLVVNAGALYYRVPQLGDKELDVVAGVLSAVDWQ